FLVHVRFFFSSRRRHTRWPRDWSSDVCSSDLLFGYAEIESESRWQLIAQAEICQRWWAYMKELMLTNPDDSPMTSELAEVFHLRSEERRVGKGCRFRWWR